MILLEYELKCLIHGCIIVWERMCVQHFPSTHTTHPHLTVGETETLAPLFSLGSLDHDTTLSYQVVTNAFDSGMSLLMVPSKWASIYGGPIH